MERMECGRYRAALERVLSHLDLAFLRGRTLVITGATGLLGTCLTDILMLWNTGQTEPVHVVAACRNPEAARKRFRAWEDAAAFHGTAFDAALPPASFPETTDYIIHAGAGSDPVTIARDPVGILTANVLGCRNLLEYGRRHGLRRFLYVSSGEVYGQSDGSVFTEESCGPVDLSQARACYPEGKRAAEVLCQSYVSQYGVDTVIARPCHLFGPSMRRGDSHAAAEFLLRAAAGEDIVLKSAGLMERSHCCVTDAAGALLFLLNRGERGRAYNVADRRLQMRIREFASRCAEAGGVGVTFGEPTEAEQKGYAKNTRMALDPSRLEALGWRPMQEDAVAWSVAVLRETGEDMT